MVFSRRDFLKLRRAIRGKRYDARKERPTIELTEQQLQALDNPDAIPPRLVNPRTKETFVLLRADESKRLNDDEYDDSPWTKEELQTLAWEAGKRAGWEDMDECDDLPEQP